MLGTEGEPTDNISSAKPLQWMKNTAARLTHCLKISLREID